MATPTGLTGEATRDISAALNGALADVFTLYLKTKNFHWHMSGPHFRDYHLLLDEHGAEIFAVTDPLAERVRKNLNERGTLEVLRRGVEMLGLAKPLMLAQFKPALAINPTIQAHYAANRLRVVRQVRHSPNAPHDALDLVLFLNGIAVATAELKSDFTQSVGDAVDQYRFDRHPAPKGGLVEPLLAFPGGALVHFAVSQSEVMMTTRLAGTETRFLPFNLGRDDGGAGNPVNPHGEATDYLWREVWAPDSWLEIIGRYLIGKRNDKKQLTSVIFPRFHQLKVTRKLVADVLAQGAGQRYLIQHSAGSGKTNSIAWAAHFLADLHNAANQKIFDSVLVVSDRTVLDTQLQEAIFDFERTTGVVASITGASGSKSQDLVLSNNTPLELQSGVPVNNLGAAKDQTLSYFIKTTQPGTQVLVGISGGAGNSGNADLYVRAGAEPTSTQYDCRPALSGNTENCTLLLAAPAGPRATLALDPGLRGPAQLRRRRGQHGRVGRRQRLCRLRTARHIGRRSGQPERSTDHQHQAGSERLQPRREATRGRSRRQQHPRRQRPAQLNRLRGPISAG